MHLKVGLAGVAAQVARSLPIRVCSLVMPTGQVRMSRTRRLHATKCSIGPYTDTSLPPEQWPTNPSSPDGILRTLSDGSFRDSDRPPTDGRLPCRVLPARSAGHRFVLGAGIANKNPGTVIARAGAGPLESPPFKLAAFVPLSAMPLAPPADGLRLCTRASIFRRFNLAL